MLKIIILSYDYPPNDGGIARLCFEIKKQLQQHGHQVRVVCPQANGTDLEQDQNVVRLPARRIRIEWEMLRYLRKNTNPGDVIITDTYHPAGLLAWLSGRKVFMLAHGAEFLPGKSFFRKKLWPVYWKWLVARADGVITNSHYTAGLVRTCSPKAKVIPIPLAVDEKSFFPCSEKNKDGFLKLCSISRLHQFKGHDFILKTIASLPEDYRQKICLSIGGKGSYQATLEALTIELGLSRQVIFAGFVPDEDLRRFYSESDVFILCTREEPGNRNVEGFGLVFAEAQACGTPVIGTRSGGIPDAIEHGNGGWLIEQDNIGELQKLLIRLIDDPDLAVKEGEKARVRVEKEYTWKKYYQKILKHIGV